MKTINKDSKNRRYTDANGDTWTEDGKFVMDDCPPGDLMDRIERRCNGEKLSPLNEEE